ncbi:MAG: hypothetical protein ABR501_14165 [Pyrinomonadaceae bacterium]
MFPGADEYGEQIDHFESFNPHIHHYLRMKEKDKHYTAFAFVPSVGKSFDHYFDHEPTRDEILKWFNKDERLRLFRKDE